jgi:predicted  nucleic acid-binding Zn-ribbon protein
MNELHRALLELQELDRAIAEAEKRMGAFAHRMVSLSAPVAALEDEAKALRKQASALDHHARTLERISFEKRGRLARYREHVDRARTAREAEAARAELQAAHDAVNADEGQALEKMELLENVQLELAALEADLARARAEEAALRQELTGAHDSALQELALLRDRREKHAIRLPANARRVYERLRGMKSDKVVIAPMTGSGACGHCFNTLPVQEQSQVRHGGALHHCETCGVVLYAADSAATS